MNEAYEEIAALSLRDIARELKIANRLKAMEIKLQAPSFAKDVDDIMERG